MKTPIAPSAVSRRGLLGLSLGFTLGMSLPQVAIAQPDILAIIGKDNYLFPAWGTTDEPNWPAIDATVARVKDELRDSFAAAILALFRVSAGLMALALLVTLTVPGLKLRGRQLPTPPADDA